MAGAPWEAFQGGDSASSGPAPWEQFSDQTPAPAPVERRGVQGIPVGGSADAPRYADETPSSKPTPKDEPTIGEKVKGAVEAARSIFNSLTSGGVGLAGGILGGVAGAAATGKWDPDEILRVGNEAAERESNKGGYTPQTQAGKDMTESANQGMQELVPLTGIHGAPAAVSDSVGRGVGAAVEGTRRGVGAAADALTPKMAPEKVALAEKAIDAGIPLRPDMLSQNKFVRGAGELAEHTPLAGGKGNARREAFSQGLHKMLDPDGEGTLTPAAYDAAMNKAGQTIGDISARTPIPESSLRNLTDVGRRETPDVQGVVKTYADDIAQVAADNDGVVPGETFRKIRSEAATQSRTSTNGDLRRTLGDFVKRMDDALSDHASDGDLDALADARQRYAIGIALQDPVAKAGNGDISPALILGRAMKDQSGKRRMARGKGGDLGDYARIGQEFLKEQPSSGTAERSALIHGAAHVATLGKTLAAIPFAAAYNLMGPRIARMMVEKARRDIEAGKPQPEPPKELTAEQAPFDPQGGGGAAQSPLGDLTPDWETAPGATPGGRPLEVVPTEGLVRSVDEASPVQQPGLRTLSPDEYPRQQAPGLDFVAEPELHNQVPDWSTGQGVGAPRQGVDGAGLTPAVGDRPVTTGSPKGNKALDIPAVAGRPGVDDVAVAGGPGNFVDAAPGALDRLQERPRPAAEPAPAPPPPAAPKDPRLAEIDRLKESATSDVVRKALDDQAKAVQKDIAGKEKQAKDKTDAAELRNVAGNTTDPEIKRSLHEQADKLDPPEKIPTGTVKEGQPEINAPTPKKIPVGKATEVDAPADAQGKPLALTSTGISPAGSSMHERRAHAQAFARENFAGKTVKNASDGSDIKIPMRGIKHALTGEVSPAAVAAIEHLDELVKTAKFVGSEADNRGRVESIKEIRNYDRDVTVDGVPAALRVVVRVAADGSRYYDHFELKEKPSAGLVREPGNADSARPFTEGPSRDGNPIVGGQDADAKIPTGQATELDADAASLLDWAAARNPKLGKK